MLSEVMFSPVKTDEGFEACTSIADEAFGDGYLSLSDFRRPNSLVFGAFHDRRLIGFFLSFIIDVDRIGDGNLKQTFKHRRKIVHLKSLGVVTQYRRNGIGTELTRCVVDFYLANGKRSFFVDLWKCGGEVPFAAIAGRFGFWAIKEVPNHWHHDSLARQYRCDVCGSPPCKCMAVLYVADFE